MATLSWTNKTKVLVGLLVDERHRRNAYNFAMAEQYKFAGADVNRFPVYKAGVPDIDACASMSGCEYTCTQCACIVYVCVRVRVYTH